MGKQHFQTMVAFCFAIALNSLEEPSVIAKSIRSLSSARPNIVLIMTDDQGWAQTGYNGHPILKTPNLDAMAANGLRFNRFYAGAPVCSPTRATVLTGRTNDRTGVYDHGYALRLEEQTLSEALREADYATGHFGKWHLNGLRGPGAPILKQDTYNPGAFGFDVWLSVTNFFDLNPLMSRNGNIEEFSGDSSSVIVDEALEFIEVQAANSKPFFAVIWDGSPHRPWRAARADRSAFAELDEGSQRHYGELVAFDRALGKLRDGLRKLDVASNTIVWYCSDNGGLPKVNPGTVGGLRGFKGSVWEGGLRVPAIIEWPLVVEESTTDCPASTLDIFPTIADLIDLPDAAMLKPMDGASLRPLLTKSSGNGETPVPFRYDDSGAFIDGDYKLVSESISRREFKLFNLAKDPSESKDISQSRPGLFQQMRKAFLVWSASVDRSALGEDYAHPASIADQPERKLWTEVERYEPYLDMWKDRPEFSDWIK